MPIPESIKSKRPTQFGAVEIRLIKGYFYVYLVSSKWDSSKGRPQKVTGKSIGKITEADGFIPNANGMRIMQAKAAASAVPRSRRIRIKGLIKERIQRRLRNPHLLSKTMVPMKRCAG